jgi:hypothetical protein
VESAVAQAISAVVGGWAVSGARQKATEKNKQTATEKIEKTKMVEGESASMEAAIAQTARKDGKLISCDEARLKLHPVWTTVAVATDKVVIRPGESKVVELSAIESMKKWQDRHPRFRNAASAMPVQARVVFDANRRASEAERTMASGAPGREMLENERTRWTGIDVAGGGYFSRVDEHGKVVVEE